jgi:deoxyribonucleoside regulator
MPEYRPPLDRELLLADVAEMYYLEGKRQAEIARLIGLTTSMVSRLLTEAHQRNMVDIRIRRPLQSDYALEIAIKERFNLQTVSVVMVRNHEFTFLKYLGAAGAQTFKRFLAPDSTIGIAWGTTLSVLADALEVAAPVPSKLVELVGAMGSRHSEYEGHGIIMRLAEKLGAEHYILNAPFLCSTAETAQALLKDDILSKPLDMARQAQIALMGAGSLEIPYATIYRYGYFSPDLIEELNRVGAVGNVCGLYYDINGQDACADFCDRLITINKNDLLSIPIRIGVVGGPDKAKPILGALRGGYINVLVTDSLTAQQVLDLTAKR